jgi:hypothetical protein
VDPNEEQPKLKEKNQIARESSSVPQQPSAPAQPAPATPPAAQGIPPPPATPVIPPVYRVPVHPAAAIPPMAPPPAGIQARFAAPVAPPVDTMPAPPSSPTPSAVFARDPVLSTPPAAPLAMPATLESHAFSSRLWFYLILGGLFLMALVVLVVFALKG